MNAPAVAPEAPYTIDCLVSRVQTIMDEEDMGVDRAVDQVHREIMDSGHLLEWWDVIGLKTVTAAVGPALERFKSPPNVQGGPKRPRRSWRDGMADDPEAVWSIEIPIGLAGRMKAVGALTPDDVRSIEAVYRTEVDKLTSRAELWGVVRRKMLPKDTLRSAWEAGRVRVQELQFIGERCFTDPVLLQADHG